MDSEARWLLLIHQLPPKPAYLRVKVWRRLQRLGAVAVKNSVYVLPASEQAREDFEWLLREIGEGGGDAVVCEARFAGGLTDEEVEEMFRDARSADYAQVAEAARALAAAGDPPEAEVERLKRRLHEAAALDFFAAPGRSEAEAALAALEPAPAAGRGGAPLPPESLRGKTWVTRRGVYVDRMASAWLVRRFVDPDAQFRFVAGRRHRAAEGEVRFDMFDGEFTHEGGRCTCEVLLERLGLEGDAALRAVAEIVHDLDLKDGRFGRPEAPGVERLVAGIARAHAGDEARLERGAALFDALYESFREPGA
ncbi:MAG TPA: chromate resistance protein ChrB domain-containing protein [Longimicrobiaceae bacterium]|nr:chromate resistance protein ChrB domain-containing protein [Longimicrobiaceae bacterium]